MNSSPISLRRFPVRLHPVLMVGCSLAFAGILPAGANTLAQALDNPALIWTAGGDVEWKAVERAGAHAGTSVAELWLETGPNSPVWGFQLESSESWLETTASGPGVFAVWVRHNFNPYVELALNVDGMSAQQLSFYDWPEAVERFSGWYRMTAFLPSGPHTIRLTHRFSNDLGTIPVDNPKVQADDARVLPALTPDFLSAIEIPAGETWFTGGGSEFRTQGAADSHDGVDSLVSDAYAEGWEYAVSTSPWLKREVTGSRTFRWWQRQLARAPGPDLVEEEWTPRQLFVPAGNREVTWSAWRLALDEFSEEPAAEVSLAEALDSGDLVFTTSGGTWKGAQTSAAPDGTDAAWTMMPANGSSWLETIVEGPASLHFAFNPQTIPSVDAGAGGETLKCTLDGTPLNLPESHAVTTPIPAGRHTVRWILTNPASIGRPALMLLDQVRVTAAASVSPGEALDAPELPWTVGGGNAAAPVWTGIASATAPDGQDAAVPPVLATGKTSWLETTVTGPGRLTFQWAGAEPPVYDWFDYQRGLSLSLDGQFLTLQNGNQPQPLLELGPGPHIIRWTATGLAERRPLMLDQVRWTPSPEAASPLFLQAVENPTDLQLFTNNAALTVVDPENSRQGGSSLRLTSPGSAVITGTTLTAVASRPGYLTYYFKGSPSGVPTSTVPGGWGIEGEWNWGLVFLEPGALTATWNIRGSTTGANPVPYLLIDKLFFESIPEIPVDQALRTPGPWRTSPGIPWTGLSEKGAWSGTGTTAAPSWLERGITGPAVISFTWTGNGMSLSLDGQEATPLTYFGQGTTRWLWLSAGTHTVRWLSTSSRSNLSKMYIGGMAGDPSLSVSGPDFLMRVPRPPDLADNMISLEANSGGLDTYWGWQPAEVESSTPEALTFRFPRPGPEIPRRYYRVRFGPR